MMQSLLKDWVEVLARSSMLTSTGKGRCDEKLTHIKTDLSLFARTDRVKILKTYQYKDEDDKFEREPFSVLVKTTNNG